MDFIVSINDLGSFGKKFRGIIKDRKLIAFHGEMGAGKTTIINALCKEFGAEGHLSSPSFSIINEYQYCDDMKDGSIYHIDLYRMSSLDEIIQAGVEDAMYSGSLCMVEWAEKAHSLFDENAVHVNIKPVSSTERLIEILLP